MVHGPENVENHCFSRYFYYKVSSFFGQDEQITFILF